jgi:hypothetical protein
LLWRAEEEKGETEVMAGAARKGTREVVVVKGVDGLAVAELVWAGRGIERVE